MMGTLDDYDDGAAVATAASLVLNCGLMLLMMINLLL